MQICKSLGSLIDSDSMNNDLKKLLDSIRISDISFQEIEREVGDFDVNDSQATFDCEIGDSTINVDEKERFIVPFDVLLNVWCAKFVEDNFGTNKKIKTFNVSVSTLLFSKHYSFLDWIKENMDMSFMKGNKKHPLYSHVISTQNRINQEIQDLLKGSDVQAKKQKFIDQIAAEAVKSLVMQYPTASPDAIHEAVRLGITHSVLLQ